MGMLIRRHRDRHSEDASPAPRKRTRSRKAPAQVDPPKAEDVEASKPADTEPDPGAGGEQVTGEGTTDADQLTESGSDQGE